MISISDPWKVKPRKGSHLNFFILGVGLLFLLICGTQRYLADPSFWFDEALLAGFFQEKFNYQHIFSYSDSQTCPRLYMAMIQALRDLFGYETIVLRFLPYFSFVVGSVVWIWLLSQRIKSSTLAALFAVGLIWSTSFWIDQAANFKQYTWDTLLALIPFCISDRRLDEAWKRSSVKWPSIVLTVPILFSYTYGITFIARVLSYLLHQVRNKKTKEISTLSFSWMGGLAVLFFFLIYRFDISLFPRNFLEGYWNPIIIGMNLDNPKQILSIIKDVFFGWYKHNLPSEIAMILGGFLVLGIYKILLDFIKDTEISRKDSRLIGYLVVLVGVFAASTLVKMPVTPGKFGLFYFFYIQVMTLIGFVYFLEFVRRFKFFGIPVFFFLVLFLNYSGKAANGARRAQTWQNMKPVIHLIEPEKANILLATPEAHPQVGNFPGGWPVREVVYIGYEHTLRDFAHHKTAYIMHLTGGAAKDQQLIERFKSEVKSMKRIGDIKFGGLYFVEF